MGVLVFWPSYSSSESIQPYFGTTPNAAAGGTTWDMNTVLPTPPGLDINGVIYNYTIQKDVNDSAKVHVQNENADGTGYIFRETDEWQVGSLGGTEIRKVVPVIPNIPRQSWGDGSIEIEGDATVEDPNVVYMYKVDPCYDPQFDPNCPGYQVQMPDIPEIDVSTIYNATDDEAVQIATVETDTDIYEDEETSENEEEDEEREEMRLEAALSAIDNSEMFANAFAQAQILAAMNLAIQMNSYYASNIPGGVYNEKTVLLDKKIEDNKQGLRNGFAQQLLHEQMVQEQYK
jgi:hypothetical protein